MSRYEIRRKLEQLKEARHEEARRAISAGIAEREAIKSSIALGTERHRRERLEALRREMGA